LGNHVTNVQIEDIEFGRNFGWFLLASASSSSAPARVLHSTTRAPTSASAAGHHSTATSASAAGHHLGGHHGLTVRAYEAVHPPIVLAGVASTTTIVVHNIGGHGIIVSIRFQAESGFDVAYGASMSTCELCTVLPDRP